MNRSQPADGIALDALLAPAELDKTQVSALMAHLGPLQTAFALAIAQGGGREDFARWRASHAALSAALDILRDARCLPAPDARDAFIVGSKLGEP